MPKGRVTVGLERRADVLVLWVGDNGPGFPVADRQRMLEPYVTSKAKGTGLGLAIVRKIMEEHHGRIELDDGRERGAVVRLIFPMQRRSPGTDRTGRQCLPRGRGYRDGRAMKKDILVVDDEVAIRDVVCAILEDEGYATRQAANSDEAIREMEARPPALMLLDIWLEGSHLDGVQILEVARKRCPDVPAIMFSGHGTIEMAVGAIKKGAYDFIEKPFKSDRLLVAAEHAIESTRLKRENEELKRRPAEAAAGGLVAGDVQIEPGHRSRGADQQSRAHQRPAGFRQGGRVLSGA